MINDEIYLHKVVMHIHWAYFISYKKSNRFSKGASAFMMELWCLQQLEHLVANRKNVSI